MAYLMQVAVAQGAIFDQIPAAQAPAKALLNSAGWVYYQIPKRPEMGYFRDISAGNHDTKAPKMIKVKSRGNETVDQMLRRFKKLCEKEGLIKDMKRVSYYEKPSEKRRRRLRKAQSRQLKVGMEM